ncbi:TolB family protein [Asanoa iriomotensis]|uniref:WD40 repeat protein n=1 Tax=Asanoa iriomotensis TaxID=234613 RepID=A0ABQ4C6S1_9ACTN|nr:LpqB family beta-propeller domain-containing protein [Asanoa iriomotensis]GIF58473.1 hypothetical protein Air01nite_45680 [Asanoa iriomotensis]
MPDIDDARLANMFTEFRDEVTPYVTPPGTAAARRWVRRRRKAGVAAIATGAVLFVGGPTVGFVAASQDTPTPPPIGPVETVTPTPTTPAPTTTPSQDTETSTPPTEPELPKVAGKVFYKGLDGKVYLNGRQYPGGNPANVTVSPDGKQVAWILDDATGDYGSDLLVSDLDGGNRRVLAREAEPLCQEPIWSADSKQLMIVAYPPSQNEKPPTQLNLVEIDGSMTHHYGRAELCHYRLSADGKRVATFSLVAGQGKITNSVIVEDLGGGDRVTLGRDIIGERVYTDMVGISADGDRVCVLTSPVDGTYGDIGGSVARCDTLLDVSARKVVDLPIDKGELVGVVFLPDGGMLARVKSGGQSELLRLDKDDRVIARSVESAANADRQLLSYTP